MNEKEAKYVKFNKDGILNTRRLNRCESESENITALKGIANSETMYFFAVSDSDGNGKPFFEKGSDPQNETNYYYGVTMIPGAENDPSQDNDVHIYSASFLSEKEQVSNTAHEAYGHGYFYEFSKTDPSINPNHTYGLVGTNTEVDQETGQNVVEFIFGKTNIKLEEQINKVEQQARKNYDERHK